MGRRAGFYRGRPGRVLRSASRPRSIYAGVVPEARSIGLLSRIGAAVALGVAGTLPAQIEVTEAQPWQFDSFLTDAGLEGCSILHLTTGPDGRLWFATSAGLACYDGFDWTRWRTAAGLPSDYVRCVAFTRAGECWVGTDQGATRFDTERGLALPTDTKLAGPSVRRIVADPRSDAVWFCCDQWPDPDVPAGLTRFAQGSWRSWTTADGLPSDYVQCMLIDSRGRHFVGTKRGVVEMLDDVPSLTLHGDDDPGSVVWSIAEEANGAIVVGMGHRLNRLTDSGWHRLPLVMSELRPVVLGTRNGTLAIASSERRILRIHNETAVPVSATWGVRSNGIECAMEGQDGAVWLVGHNELLRWRRGGEWRLYADCPSPVLTDGTGAVWFVDRRGTFVFADERWLHAGPLTRSLCVGPDRAVWGVRPPHVVRWATGSSATPEGLATPEAIATEVTEASRIHVTDRTIVIVGRDGNGEAALVAGLPDAWRRVATPPGFDSAAATLVYDGGGGDLWMLLQTDTQTRVLYRLVGDRLTRVPGPESVLHPISMRMVVDPEGSPWVYGMFGLLQLRAGGWERAADVGFQHIHAATVIGDALALTTRSTAGGVGGLSLTWIEDGARVWRRIEGSGEVALGTDRQGRLLLTDDHTIHRIDARGDLRSLRLPVAMDLRVATRGHGDELWFSGAAEHVLRYAPDGLAPRVRLAAMDTAVTERERIVLDVEIREFHKPQSASLDARSFVSIDGMEAATFTQARRPFFLPGLARGPHRIEVHVEDDSGAPGWNSLETEIVVAARPLQEQPWFWLAVALAMLAVLALAAHSLMVGRRLAAQTRSLTETVEVRTRELRARDEVLLHAQKMEAVGRLAGGVAHDFNNLLTVILGNLDLVRRSLVSDADPERLATLGEVEDAAQRACSLVRQLLSFSRRGPTGSTSTDAVESMRATASLLRRMIPANIDLCLELEDESLFVGCGRSELEQVVTNLVVNGADAMPDGGRLVLALTRCTKARPGEDAAEAFACIEVRDEGCGMTEDVAARAFDPYFTTKPQERGTGLGLSIVHGVLMQISGFIEMETAPGAGTRARAYFPLAAATAPHDPDAALPAPRGDGRTVLLCEDEPALLQLSIRVLREAGYRVFAHATVRACLDHDARHEGAIDVLVTDIVTKDRSGIELARVIAARRPGIPILFISGFADQALTMHRVDPDSIRLLRKPFEPEELLRAVADTIRRANAT